MKKQKIVQHEFKIDNYADRRELCAIFANAGYGIRVEEREGSTYSTTKEYWIIIEGREEG